MQRGIEACLACSAELQASQKGSRHRLQNVGQQHDVFWPAMASLWLVVTFTSLLNAAQKLTRLFTLSADNCEGSLEITRKTTVGVFACIRC